MKVRAIKCLKCGDLVYSRANHDMRWCTCESNAIDGGFEYTRISTGPGDSYGGVHEINIKATKQQLYNDWNSRRDRYGIIKANGITRAIVKVNKKKPKQPLT